MDDDTPLLHPIRSVERKLGIGHTTVYEEIKAGRLRVVKIGRRTFVKHAELERYVDALQPAA